MATTHIFGIRHHGPGCARSLRMSLEALRPDIVLVEGPPDAHDVLPLLSHAEMRPPVALLIYAPEEPRLCAFYPLAVFSPEWQAIHFAQQQNIPVRFMDLPAAHFLAQDKAAREKVMQEMAAQAEAAQAEGVQSDGAPPEIEPLKIEQATETAIDESVEAQPGSSTRLEEERSAEKAQTATDEWRRDPLRHLAQAAGYDDSERWWEQMVEHRRDDNEVFEAIAEAMTALRENLPQDLRPDEALLEEQREAWMRQTIRGAQKEGFERIAVICGAWHAPALQTMSNAKTDAETLKGLPKIKVQSTWVPWTHGRLQFASGYGAGVGSPGWYGHLWTTHDRVTIRWMTRVAALLRDEDIDVSSAHVIEAVRLAETLAAFRDRSLPGLDEVNEAIQTVFCFGDDLPLQLIRRKLIVGETMGTVPDETPGVPLQNDLTRESKRLRLPLEAAQKTLDLDLRKPNDLDRSRLLHRLGLLGVSWGTVQRTGGSGSTFHEVWITEWRPEYSIALVEAGVWGNTVLDAATAFASHQANQAGQLPALTALLDRVLLADLPQATRALMTQLEVAALSSDVSHLMEALSPLANVLRYGNVRGTDTDLIAHVVDGLVTRIGVGLPAACSSLNDEAATEMMTRIASVNAAIKLLQNEDYTSIWNRVLVRLSTQNGLHGLLAGKCCRILLDGHVLPTDEVAERMQFALSGGVEPIHAAARLEGFLAGSGLLLLHDRSLWDILDAWLSALAPDVFTATLPLLRRTFSSFAAPERRQMGELVRRDKGQSPMQSSTRLADDFDAQRAAQILPLLRQLLGLETR